MAASGERQRARGKRTGGGSALWARQASVNAEAAELAERVFLAPEAADVETGTCGQSVHYGVWRSGALFVVAANRAEASAELAVNLAALTGQNVDAGRILFEEREIRARGGRLLDTLGPFPCRVYEFQPAL